MKYIENIENREIIKNIKNISTAYSCLLAISLLNVLAEALITAPLCVLASVHVLGLMFGLSLSCFQNLLHDFSEKMV